MKHNKRRYLYGKQTVVIIGEGSGLIAYLFDPYDMADIIIENTKIRKYLAIEEITIKNIKVDL